jgi:stearoyl-CoA desaturase (Delta-9 desaturase)
MAILVGFLVVHWSLSIFCQTFYLHRYGAHRMFTMSKPVERFFHLLTAISQGSSFLLPRGYAILHREHHAFSDTERDPHSPHVYGGFGKMMWATKNRYAGLASGAIRSEPRFEGGTPEWPAVDKFFNAWPVRIGFGVAYTIPYLLFAPHWAFYLLLPIHYVIGPIHGAIVNWCGHKYGYRNFDTPHGDKSRNTLVFDFVTWGELFQNNHHARSMSPNFAARWFEIDPTWILVQPLLWLKVIRLANQPKATDDSIGARRETAGRRALASEVLEVPPIADVGTSASA